MKIQLPQCLCWNSWLYNDFYWIDYEWKLILTSKEIILYCVVLFELKTRRNWIWHTKQREGLILLLYVFNFIVNFKLLVKWSFYINYRWFYMKFGNDKCFQKNSKRLCSPSIFGHHLSWTYNLPTEACTLPYLLCRDWNNLGRLTYPKGLRSANWILF